MCIEDIRLGRKTILYRSRINVPAGTTVQILPYAPDRFSILFPNVGENSDIRLDTEQSTTADTGLEQLRLDNLRLNIKNDGVLVTSEWFCINAGLTDFVITIWETRLRDQ